MHLIVVSTGGTRDKNILALEATYHSRMLSGWPVTVKEIKDNPNPDTEAATQLAAIQSLPEPRILIALDETGKTLTSPTFSRQLQEFANRGARTIAFLIGGADGLSDRVRQQADLVLSLSALTLPHQLVRVFLAEQLYRAGTLMSGHPYHRA
jgi:23S rRNA (pseudouridine1915-N3)-methyltransferase